MNAGYLKVKCKSNHSLRIFVCLDFNMDELGYQVNDDEPCFAIMEGFVIQGMNMFAFMVYSPPFDRDCAP